MYICTCVYVYIYSTTCLVSTLVSEYMYFTWSLAHVHTLCQPVLIIFTIDKKYRFGVPFKVLSKHVVLYFALKCKLHKWL